MKIPIVSIIGKPNVGKSTFFNRMAGARVSITTDIAGTTRDRIFHKVSHKEMDFYLVDTGGLEFEKKANQDIESNMQRQSKIAIDEADLILFMVNAKEPFTSDDFKAAELIRRASNKKSVLLIANKCDHQMSESDLAYMYELGLGEPIGISALHNSGLDKLSSQIIQGLKKRHFLTKNNESYQTLKAEEEKFIQVAMVGKPNVGKSSLVNALLNKEKHIVSDKPGTTRDSSDSLITRHGKKYNFIDTAGIRRRGKIERGIEKFSVLRTLSSIERCDIALLILDSSQPISHLDQQIANTILGFYKGLIIVANKWDIKEDEIAERLAEKEREKEEKEELTESEVKKENPQTRAKEKYIAKLQHRFPFLSWAPVVFTSAVNKKNLNKIFDQIPFIMSERKKRIPTAKLNHFIEKAVVNHPPAGTKKINPKLFYTTQSSIEPPCFVYFVNKKKYFHFSYLRYLENRLREEFGFSGTPIKMEYREKEQRYGNKKK